MTFNVRPLVLAMGSVACACGLLVTPPEGYPPEDDVTGPAAPPAVSVAMGVQILNANCKPAVIIRWESSASSDLLYYKVYREYKKDLRDIAATLKTTRYYFDTNIDFPDNADAGYRYYCFVTAFDSSGNESVPSVEETLSLVAPPVLLYPTGGIGPDDLQSHPFAWNVLYKVGKSFEVAIMAAAGDTLVSARFDPGGYDIVNVRKSYIELKALSDRPGPERLTPGTYYWWVIVTLSEGTGKTPNRKAAAVSPFTIQE